MPADDAPDGSGLTLTRRRFLAWSAASAVLAACELAGPTDRPSSVPGPSATPEPSSAGTSAVSTPTPAPSATAPATPRPSQSPSAHAGRTLFRDGALADARSERLRRGVSILVEGGVISWIRPSDDEGDRGPRNTLEVVDASGTSFVPGMVDAHSHVTLPGGAHWIDRFDDDPTALLEVAERNGRLLTGAGVRWARDVGAPRVEDPTTGRRRALSLAVRDRWLGRPGYPYLRAAGTWLTQRGSLSSATHRIEVDSADELVAQAVGQLDDGADLVKLYLDGPDASTSPWTATEIARVVNAVHARDARVTAHATQLAGARAGVRGGVDAIEHGYQLDRDLCAEMVRRGTFLVSTLAVMRSWQTFARTTNMSQFTDAARRRFIQDRLARARVSVRLARDAGVKIAAGTDFGGGSLRANQLAWEVGQLVVAGLEPWQALAAATWRGGDLLGEADAGVIREGGPADFFLVHGDPLSEPAALWRVWRVAWAE
jgi:imidazolonepropionase-like amidohydrolase